MEEYFDVDIFWMTFLTLSFFLCLYKLISLCLAGEDGDEEEEETW